MAYVKPPRNPVDAFIRELGGPSEVARKLSLRPSTVSAWQLCGRIPKWRVGDLAELAHDRGLPMPLERAA